jgi:hypothetical protein
MPTRKELGLKRDEKCRWIPDEWEIQSYSGFITQNKTDLGINGVVYHPDKEPMPIFLFLTVQERREYFALMKRIQRRIQSQEHEYDEKADEPIWYSAENPIPDH